MTRNARVSPDRVSLENGSFTLHGNHAIVVCKSNQHGRNLGVLQPTRGRRARLEYRNLHEDWSYVDSSRGRLGKSCVAAGKSLDKLTSYPTLYVSNQTRFYLHCFLCINMHPYPVSLAQSWSSAGTSVSSADCCLSGLRFKDHWINGIPDGTEAAYFP